MLIFCESFIMYKKYFVLYLVFSHAAFSSVISREESITMDTYNNLTVSARPYPDATETRDMDLVTFNARFHEIDQQNVDMRCGKLEMDFGPWFWPTKYVGSGSLINYDASTQQFEGITAKHNIFDNKAWWYKQAYHVIFHIGEDRGGNVGQISVNSSIPHPNLDVCLFYGTYNGQNRNAIVAGLPQISDDPTLSNRNFNIIHYPNGTGNQRSNNGIIRNVRGQHGYYTVDTLGGSSGAPLFDVGTNQIFGVHVCGHERPDLAIRYNDGQSEKKLKVSTENECILIDNNFIATLRGNTLYRL